MMEGDDDGRAGDAGFGAAGDEQGHGGLVLHVWHSSALSVTMGRAL